MGIANKVLQIQALPPLSSQPLTGVHTGDNLSLHIKQNGKMCGQNQNIDFLHHFLAVSGALLSYKVLSKALNLHSSLSRKLLVNYLALTLTLCLTHTHTLTDKVEAEN